VCQEGTSQPHEKHIFQKLYNFAVLEKAGLCIIGAKCAGAAGMPGTVVGAAGGAATGGIPGTAVGTYCPLVFPLRPPLRLRSRPPLLYC
jgi:hypothetical protein